MEQTENDFRSSVAMVVMSKLLENPEYIIDEYIHRQSDYTDMNIYEFLSDAAVNYADALIKRLSE